METKKIKRFPCPVCKGQGGWTEVVIEETGQGPYYECGYCDGEALIEIGGKKHKEIQAFSRGIKMLEEGKDYSREEIIALGEDKQ